MPKLRIILSACVLVGVLVCAAACAEADVRNSRREDARFMVGAPRTKTLERIRQ